MCDLSPALGQQPLDQSESFVLNLSFRFLKQFLFFLKRDDNDDYDDNEEELEEEDKDDEDILWIRFHQGRTVGRVKVRTYCSPELHKKSRSKKDITKTAL